MLFVKKPRFRFRVAFFAILVSTKSFSFLRTKKRRGSRNDFRRVLYVKKFFCRNVEIEQPFVRTPIVDENSGDVPRSVVGISHEKVRNGDLDHWMASFSRFTFDNGDPRL